MNRCHSSQIGIKPQDICGNCKVDRRVMVVMLEQAGSDDWEIARKILGNCYACRTWYRHRKNRRK